MTAIALALPILAAVGLSVQQGRQAVGQMSLALARDVLMRSEVTTDQVRDTVRQLVDAGLEPCSPEHLTLMRRLDLASSNIQAVGVVRDGRLECSSLGIQGSAEELGPPQIELPDGARVRTNVVFRAAPQARFLVIEREGYAAIIHRAVPTDVGLGRSDAILGTFSAINGHVVTATAELSPAWMDMTLWKGQEVFEDSGYLVARLYSDRIGLGVIAATRGRQVRAQVVRAARLLVPVGLLAGLMLAGLAYYFSRARLALPHLIKLALRRREFFLVYEPVVDLQTGQWVGAEALLRWRRPDGQLMRPDHFIPVAEASGLIGDITQRVIELVGRDVGELFRRHPGFRLGINLAASDLESPHTVARVAELVRRTQAPAGALMAEATEHGLAHPEKAAPIVAALRTLGLRVAVDDFGTGYSSLASLQRFTLDCIKIDKCFIDSIGTQAATSQVVPHIIEMGKALGLEMIAEGVETEAQADFLRARGVRYSQGWLFSKPMSMSELLRRLSAAPAAL